MASHQDLCSDCNAVSTAASSTCSHGNLRADDDVRHTSTPVPDCHGAGNNPQRPVVPDLDMSSVNVSSETGSEAMDTDSLSEATLSASSEPEREELEPGHIAVPILGYEVMEERARFSVFKIQVSRGPDDVWFIFRRYSDFDHLNNKLKQIFPHFRLALPPKKWFGDNFDKNFLEDRMIGLQAFLNNLVGNREVCNSQPVRDFFCFDDPPGPHDSLEESRALCENLEERVFSLHQQVAERDRRIMLLEDQLRLSQLQVENLRKALKMEKNAAKRSSYSSLSSMTEVAELDELQASGDSEDVRLDHQSEVKVPEPDLSVDSVCLTNSFKAAESIRLSAVVEQQEAESDSIDRERSGSVPQIKREPAVDSGSSQHESADGSVPAPKSANQQTADSLTSQPTHQGATHNSTARYDPGHATGPGELCLPGNEAAASSSRVTASSSPRPKHRTLDPPPGDEETTSPGAHSVDSSSKKRATCAASTKIDPCTTPTNKDDSYNNNEAVLI